MLSDIIARCPTNRAVFRGRLSTARTHVGEMEKVVRGHSGGVIPKHEGTRFNDRLIDIQSDLGELASTRGFDDSQGAMQ
jgi:hypothetical protein